jgi:hypothetical protein
MLDPAQKKKAQQLQAAEVSAQHDYNAFFNKAQTHGAPTSTTTTTTTRGAVSGPSLNRREAFLRIKRDHPKASPADINDFLDKKGVH